MARLTSKQIIHDVATGKDFEQHYIFGHRWGPAYFKRGSADYEEYSKLLNRLVAYEDTGLEPEDINVIKAIYVPDHEELKAYKDLGTVEELTELVEVKEQREQGCDCCSKEKDINNFYFNIAEAITYGHGYSSNSYHFHLYVESNKFLTLKGFNSWGSMTRRAKINFCPMCGRPLKEGNNERD